MNKSEAIQAFGNGAKLAKAMGITRQAVYQMPEDLSQKHIDWIVGAAKRSGITFPKELLPDDEYMVSSES